MEWICTVLKGKRERERKLQEKEELGKQYGQKKTDIVDRMQDRENKDT